MAPQSVESNKDALVAHNFEFDLRVGVSFEAQLAGNPTQVVRSFELEMIALDRGKGSIDNGVFRFSPHGLLCQWIRLHSLAPFKKACQDARQKLKKIYNNFSKIDIFN